MSNDLSANMRLARARARTDERRRVARLQHAVEMAERHHREIESYIETLSPATLLMQSVRFAYDETRGK